jgi:hypothetical protein
MSILALFLDDYGIADETRGGFEEGSRGSRCLWSGRLLGLVQHTLEASMKVSSWTHYTAMLPRSTPDCSPVATSL